MKNKFLILLLIITVIFVSLGIIFIRMPSDKIFDNYGRAEATPYNVSFYNNLEEIIFTTSPLNDYYYQGLTKQHLVNKLKGSRNRQILQELRLTLDGLFFNKKEFFWNAEVVDLKNDFAVTYEIKSGNNKIEILRTIKSPRKEFDSIGLALTFCSKCMVTDDKKRAYLNENFIEMDKISFLKKKNFIPVVVREGQFLPSDISRLIVLNEAGRVDMEIPVAIGQQISVQDKWGILELKTPVKKGKEAVINQIIYIPKI